jgi:hypothetical protein
MGWMGLGLLAIAECNSVGSSSSWRRLYSVLQSVPCSWRDGIFVCRVATRLCGGKAKKAGQGSNAEYLFLITSNKFKIVKQLNKNERKL